MARTNVLLTMTIAFIFFLTGCAQVGGNPTFPVGLPTGDTGITGPGSSAGQLSNRALWGVWDIVFDPDSGTVTTQPDRQLKVHFDVTEYILPPSCLDCIQIIQNSWNPVTKIIDIDVTLRNPFPVPGYDVRGIYYTNDYGHELLNPDAWVSIWDIPGGDDINPFITFAKTVPNRMFDEGAEYTENYVLYLPDFLAIKYAVDASWPDNCEEPYEIIPPSETPAFDENGYEIAKFDITVKDWQEDDLKVTIDASELGFTEPVETIKVSPDTFQASFSNENKKVQGTYELMIEARSPESPVSLFQNMIIEIYPYSPHDIVTEGTSEICSGLSVSRVRIISEKAEPVVWAGELATGGDKLGLQRTLPVPGWVGHFGMGRFAVWAGHEGFFGSGSDGHLDNNQIRRQIIEWLLNEGHRIGFTDTHGEWLTVDGFSSYLKSWFDSESITYESIGTAPTPEILGDYELVVIGNPWADFPSTEMDALEEWVAGGGSILVMGLGWSWYAYHDDPEGDDYPVNQLGQRFGWEVMNGWIYDPDAPNGNPGQPSFEILLLDEFTPAEVVILRTSETDVDIVTELAVSNPEDIYVVESEYMGIQFANDDWPLLASPSEAIQIMDNYYLAHIDLVSDNNRPYGGDIIWAISKVDPDGAYWMHSGNPIVFKKQAAQAEIIPNFNSNQMPGWGLVHENGHNMHLSACGHLFGRSGTIEEWCNVFTVWAYDQLSWSYDPSIFDDGHDYHYQENPDFSELTSSCWILLGCLELIWDKYGWGGMQIFMSKAAEDTANGITSPDDETRTAYFVEQLSHAYQLDFAPLIIHWGFPVTGQSQDITSVYPPADIPWQ